MRALCIAFLMVVFLNPVQAQEPGTGLTPVKERPRAPDFELTDIDGNIHRLSSYRAIGSRDWDDEELLGLVRALNEVTPPPQAFHDARVARQ